MADIFLTHFKTWGCSSEDHREDLERCEALRKLYGEKPRPKQR